MGYSARLQIVITQHMRDVLLMNNFLGIFNCGYITKYSNRNIVNFVVTKFNDIYNKLIPLFNQYEIKGVKYLYYKDLCKAA
jgi:LAGLIDADG endonuclease